jgi:hypothetical protein
MPKKSTKKRPTEKAKPAPQVQAALTRCPACGSTDRESYSGTLTQEFGGVTPDGKPYTHIVRRRTICRACGQCRVDRFFENRASSDRLA